MFDELSDILAPYYMGANAPLAAEDSEIDESADPEGDGSSKSSSMAAAARAGGVFARLGPALEQMQKFVAKAALLLWLWFDQQCEVMAEEVRGAQGSHPCSGATCVALGTAAFACPVCFGPCAQGILCWALVHAVLCCVEGGHMSLKCIQLCFRQSAQTRLICTLHWTFQTLLHVHAACVLCLRR